VSRTSFFQDLLSSVADRGRGILGPSGESKPSVDAIITDCDTLLTSRGEASGVALAARVLARVNDLDGPGKLAFFQRLAERYSPDPHEVEGAAMAYAEEPTAENLSQLFEVAEPPRQELFRRLNLAPGATRALVDMRRELQAHLSDKPDLRLVDRDLVHLFVSWFNRGFLVLQRIDWQTPAHILEKLIQYEAVHEIHGWDDLRRRLAPADRRCFAFFHPALPDDPLIFVEVALTESIPDNIAGVLSEDRQIVTDEKRTVAAFYSISNCQEGLKSISFGNFLIKQVVEDLKAGLPSLKTFVTLSPAPGFRRWLQNYAAQGSSDRRELVGRLEQTGWAEQEKISKDLEKQVLPLAAEYFLIAKRPDGEPVDPVARFHLGNGASLHQLNWLGDRSEKGMKQSAGLMVNFLYDLSSIESNHEKYAARAEVAASRAVRGLLPAQLAKKLRVPSNV